MVLERAPSRVQPPPMYQVVMLNDDYTPMEFVVVVLQEFFGKDQATATQIMQKIHFEGKGICGVYSRDVATTASCPSNARRASSSRSMSFLTWGSAAPPWPPSPTR